MNTISASAPPARIRPLHVVAKAARKLGDLIAPRDHAGKGNWSNDADIPPLVAWFAGFGFGFAAFFLFAPKVLGWLLRTIV
ncbi:hypothetical protein OII53_22160 [Achromobacter ruhlandii]|uniref:hypothetical protein n=1 Tax=Achromobacter ruhlandii TaxID=72557 RepID=UPI0021F0E0E1|nr:hypothetical protein [Achromobacter ruhlandii]MCV6798521.1 hypothetical protein [Achromobacter ruhlandii]MCV6802159.1 hypothetical protein [Achromobacter ruhlandii]MCV6810863.1 hypothetical protein [Achromobacter ruhlandii]MCV6821261.1 hypothetical protein [Achromobacter ruhlandii]